MQKRKGADASACEKPQRRRRRASGAGDRLLLGYRDEEPARRVGFGEAPPATHRLGDPIYVEGEGHMITIAPTGQGKGRSALIPNLLMYEGPAIVIDPKGEAYRVTARRRREMGQKVYVLDPFGLVTDETDSLNPMDAFKIPGIDPSTVAMDIAKQLSGGARSLQDPFWDVRGHDLAGGVICAVGTALPPEERTLKKARHYLKSDDAVYGLAVLLDTMGKSMHRYGYEEIASFLQTEDRCRSGIHATACSYFSVIASDAAQRSIMSSSIDLDAVTRGDPLTIYMVVPPMKLASHASLFRLWTSMLMAAVLSRRDRLPKHRTLFAIDEAAQIGDFEMLAMIYTLARSYGMRVWTFFQDLAQIKRVLPKEWSTVLTNSAGIQVFGVANHLMASDLAPVLGDFSEDALRRMDGEHLALQLTGRSGFAARKLDYLHDPMFSGWFDPNPMAKTGR